MSPPAAGPPVGPQPRPTGPKRGRLSVAVGALALACAGAPACRTSHAGRDRQVPGPLASALLAFAAAHGTAPEEVAATWRAIGGIADRVDARPRAEGEDVVDSLNAVVFGELGFSREVERTAPRYMLLPSVVADRRGSCVGLGALYLVLAERLGIPLDGIMVPGHFFVRVPAASGTHARARNVELLRRGEAMPDSWYLAKYGPWPAEATAYFRPLAAGEVLAIHWFNLGNERRGDRDWAGAGEAYGRAVDELPAFAEAWASLGAARQALGDPVGAARAYRAAAREHPGLPGLAENLSLLRAVDRPADPNAWSNHMGADPRRSLP